MTTGGPGFGEVAGSVAPALVGAARLILGDPGEADHLVVEVLADARSRWDEWREVRPVRRLGGELLVRAHHSASRMPSGRESVGPVPGDPTDDGATDPPDHLTESLVALMDEPDEASVPAGQVTVARDRATEPTQREPPASGGPTDPAEDLLERVLRGTTPEVRTLLAGRALLDQDPEETERLIGALTGSARRDLADLERRTVAVLSRAHWFGDLDALVRLVYLDPTTRALIDDAEGVVHRRLVRRRLLLTGGLVALGALGAGVARFDPADPGPPALTAPTSTGGSPRSAGGSLTGIRQFDGFDLARLPPSDQWDTLPMLPGVLASTAIPEQWGVRSLEDSAMLSRLLTAPGSIRAVFLYDAGGVPLPVLHIPKHDPPYVALDTVDLAGAPASGDLAGQPAAGGLAWGTRVIDDQRRRVAIVRKGELIVVEPGTGRTTRTTVPVTDVVAAGWAVGSRWFVVIGASRSVRVDPASGIVEEIHDRAAYGRRGLSLVDDGLQLVDADYRGVVFRQRPIPGPVSATFGDSVTNLVGWVARAVRISPFVVGLMAVMWDLSPQVAMLTMPGPELVRPPMAIGWARGDNLLFLVAAPGHVALLAWDIIDNTIRRVARLPTPEVTPWTGLVSLSP